MHTITVFSHETPSNRKGTFKIKKIGNKSLIIMYHKENLSKSELFFYKRKINKNIKNSLVVKNQFSENIKCDKIYYSGCNLVKSHLFWLLRKMRVSEPVCVYTSDYMHINEVYDIIMNYKKVMFITYEHLKNIFDDILFKEYGITGAVFSDTFPNCGTSIILPGGESLIKKNTAPIINLSDSFIEYKCISPENILFTPPAELNEFAFELRRSDTLETVMNFFDIPYKNATLNSVKFNKAFNN